MDGGYFLYVFVPTFKPSHCTLVRNVYVCERDSVRLHLILAFVICKHPFPLQLLA